MSGRHSPETQPTLSPAIVLEFCNFCQWTYEVWQNHVELFENNKHLTAPLDLYVKKELSRLSVISQEYGLLQIVKLHDKAVMNGKITLGIDYVLTYGGWSAPVRERLESLKIELESLADQLRGARNKILSHYDLPTILAGAPLGEFAKGDDERYFRALQEFVDTVHGEIIRGPWPFCNLVKNDVVAFLVRINGR